MDVSIELTYDEIEFLCGILGEEMPVGVAVETFDLPDEVRNRLIDGARESLTRRKILEETEGGHRVQDAVADVLEIATKPALVLSVEVDSRVRPEMHVLLCNEDLGVEVEDRSRGVYGFTPFVTHELTRRFVAACDLRPAPAFPGATCELGSEHLATAGDLADDDVAAATHYLIAQGVSEDVASRLAIALADRDRTVQAVALYNHADDGVIGGALSWIDAGLAGIWLCEPETFDVAPLDTDDQPLTITSVTGEHILSTLVSYLPQEFDPTS